MGKDDPPRALLERCGFVHAEDSLPFSASIREHVFLLMHDGHAWDVYSSFFGGNVGSYVRIPGPNREAWSRIQLVAPIGSKDWRTSVPVVDKRPKVRIAWNDASVIIPSVKLQHTESEIKVVAEPRRRSP